jgi:hypothetical protein
MLSKDRGSVFSRMRHLAPASVAAFGFLIASLEATNAQDAEWSEPNSLPDYQVTPPAQPAPSIELNSPNESTSPNIEPTTTRGYSAEPRRFQYALRLTIRGVYDDNINISQTNRISDYYVAIEPSITLGFGDIVGHQENYIRLDYIPSVFLFADHSEDDAVQHLVRLEGHHRFSRLDLTMSQDIQILDGANLSTTTDTTGSHANLDVGARTRVNIYTTQLNATYQLTGKTFLSSGLYGAVTDYHTLISSEVVSGNLFINYNYSEKVVIGLGGTGGYDLVDDPDPDQTFEQANVRLSYQATGKVSLNASGGVEFRQFENSSRGEHVSPVFQIGAAYQPFDGTSLSLDVNRRTLNSAVFAGQNFASTNVSVGVTQRLLQRVFLGLSAGYENSDYFSVFSGVSATRRDNYYFVEPAIDVGITRFWAIGAYYLHRQNDSSLDSFGFYNNQVGLRTTLRF